MDDRPTKDKYYLNIAREVCYRSTCLRRRYGAVIVKNDQIVSTGYVGAPRGVANCIDLKVCLRQQLGVAHGQNYELCRSVHAEMNAVIHASRSQTLGAVLYLSGMEVITNLPVKYPEPCLLCRRVIINAGFNFVIVHPFGKTIVYLDPQDWVYQENKISY